MKSASLTASLLVSKGAAKPSLPREILDPANYVDLDDSPLEQEAKKVERPVRPTCPTQSVATVKKKAVPVKPVPKAKPIKEGATERISTTVRLPEGVHKRLRLLAARDRVNLQSLLVKATADLLANELGDDDCVCSEK